jgi:hypothetical protein
MEDSGFMVRGIWCCIVGCVFVALSLNGQAYQNETKREKSSYLCFIFMTI